MFESAIAENALSKPALMAACGELPARNSSRMRSKMSTLASAAMPMVRTTPAIPGSDNEACSSDMSATSITTFITRMTFAIKPKVR
jgi:hypothetical protein